MPEGSGVINGKASVVILPGLYDGLTRTTDYLDPAGLTAHLTPTEKPDVELTYPAGSWFQPPPGSYRIWLQGDWRMTPFTVVMLYSGQATSGNMGVGLAIGEAGRVRLPPDADTAPGFDLHLLHAGSYVQEGFARWEMSPRRAAADVGDGVLMPVGTAVGALWNRASRKYVALSRPFQVRSRETVEVPLQKPRGEADLVARLRRSPVADTAADLEVRLALKQKDKERAPDLAVFSADKVYAYWYGLEPGTAELRGGSDQVFLESLQLDLRPGSIELVDAELRLRPALDIQVDLPAALSQETLALEVRRPLTGEVLARRVLDPAARSHRLERLPPELLEIELRTSLGALTSRVDLSSGEDGFLLLKPPLITLTGTVHCGNESHPAKLTFANAVRETEIRTEEDGRYEAVFLEPVQTVSIECDEIDAPYFDFFLPAIAESRELDFHLPDAEHRVRVTDAATGKGVPKAVVDLRNSFLQEDPRDGKKRERAVFQSTRTDDTGMAFLPPLRQGAVEIRIAAPGYSPMREPFRAPVPDEESDQTFEIRLEPIGDTATLRLQLPGGAPAAGAQVMLVDSLLGGKSLFSAHADAEGRTELPRDQRGALLVRHPGAAFLVRDWQPGEEKNEIEWTLTPAADQPLVLRVRDSSGAGAGGADLALWVGGRFLSGGLLAWLADAAPRADASGAWAGRNLPQGPVRILAWVPRTRGDVVPAHLESESVLVFFPWSGVIEVRAAD